RASSADCPNISETPAHLRLSSQPCCSCGCSCTTSTGTRSFCGSDRAALHQGITGRVPTCRARNRAPDNSRQVVLHPKRVDCARSPLRRGPRNIALHVVAAVTDGPGYLATTVPSARTEFRLFPKLAQRISPLSIRWFRPERLHRCGSQMRSQSVRLSG